MKIIINSRRRQSGLVFLWVVLAVLVLVIAAVVVYKIIKFCEKAFPVPDPKNPPNQNTNEDNRAFTGYISQMWIDSDQGMTASPDLVVRQHYYCLIDYGMTNVNGTNAPWLQIDRMGVVTPDPTPYTTMAGAVQQAMADAGEPVANLGMDYNTNTGVWSFFDASQDATGTNVVVIYRGSDAQLSDRVPVFTNSITDDGMFQFADTNAYQGRCFYGAVRSP